MKAILIATLLFLSVDSQAQNQQPKPKLPQLIQGSSQLKIQAIKNLAQFSSGTEGVGGGDAVPNQQGGWGLLDLNETLPYNYIIPAPYQSNTRYELDRHISHTLVCGFKITNNKNNIEMFLAEALDYLTIQRLKETKDIHKDNIKKLGDQLIWIGTNTPLENIPDEGVVRLEDPSTKQQVAVQKDGVVMVYLPIFEKMNSKNRAALMMHEALLRVVLKLNPNSYAKNGTAKIREFVNLLFNREFYQLPEPVIEKVCGTNSELFN